MNLIELIWKFDRSEPTEPEQHAAGRFQPVVVAVESAEQRADQSPRLVGGVHVAVARHTVVDQFDRLQFGGDEQRHVGHLPDVVRQWNDGRQWPTKSTSKSVRSERLQRPTEPITGARFQRIRQILQRQLRTFATQRIQLLPGLPDVTPPESADPARREGVATLRQQQRRRPRHSTTTTVGHLMAPILVSSFLLPRPRSNHQIGVSLAHLHRNICISFDYLRVGICLKKFLNFTERL